MVAGPVYKTSPVGFSRTEGDTITPGTAATLELNTTLGDAASTRGVIASLVTVLSWDPLGDSQSLSGPFLESTKILTRV